MAGDQASSLRVKADASIAFQEGRVIGIGDEGTFAGWEADRRLDASGAIVVPGFVDAHTHPVFSGDRAHELVQKLQGVPYEQILADGGGIYSTVDATRAATEQELRGLLDARVSRLLRLGTTTLEAKTGYALSVSGELQLLQIIEASRREHAATIVPTLLGAHAVPRRRDRGEFVDAVCDSLTPAAAKAGARFCDAFVDEGAFTVEEGRRVLQAGKDAGLDVRIHADELACTRATRLGVELGAVSIDHVNQVHEADIEALGSDSFSGVATLCPVTPFTSSIPYAPARELIEAGVPVALGSDLNPNAWSEGMLFTIGLAVHEMQMRPQEALVAATVNSAYSLGLPDRGRLEDGCWGDAVVLEYPSVDHLGYRLGGDPIRAVIKEGQVVHEQGPN